MKRKTLEALIGAIVPVVKEFIGTQITAAQVELRALISQQPKPKDGVDGKSITVEDVTPLIKELIDSSIPKSGDLVPAVLEAIEAPAVPSLDEIVAQMTPLIPTADAIVPIVLGKLQIPTAADVAALVHVPAAPTPEDILKLVTLPTVDEIAARVRVPTAEEVAAKVQLPELPELPELPPIPTLDEVVAQLVPHIPAPIKGDKGDRGDKGDPGAAAEPLDMDAVAKLIEGNFSRWALDFERRATDLVQRFLDRIEKPKDGIDGFGFDDLTVSYDGDRLVTLSFAREGKETKSFPFELPIVIYRGVYRAGESYDRGDSVTWDGGTWIAKAATTDKPGQSDAWQLAVKKGRDGRDGDDPSKRPTKVRVAPRT